MWTKEREVWTHLQTGETVPYDPWVPLIEELRFGVRLLSHVADRDERPGVLDPEWAPVAEQVRGDAQPREREG